jgi:hypothetical protein
MNAETLHQKARAGETPREFQKARTQLDDAAAKVEERRDVLHDLILAAHRLGVGPAALARWSGYDPSRVYQILEYEIPATTWADAAYQLRAFHTMLTEAIADARA